MSAKVQQSQIRTLVADLLPNDTLRAAAVSDIDRHGNFGEEWLVLTESHVAVIEGPVESGSVRQALAIDTIEELNALPLVGSTLLEARDNRGWHRLIAYSHAKNSAFTPVIGQLKSALDKNSAAHEHALEPGPELTESDERKRPGSKGEAFLRIFSFSRPYAPQLVLLFVFMILGTGFGLITPYMSKLFIDYIFNQNPQTGAFPYAHWLPLVALALLLAHAAQLFFNALQTRMSGFLGHKTVYDVRATLYGKLQDLSLSYFDKHQTGAIVARVNQDTGELQRFLVDFFPLTLESLFTLVGVGAFLFALSWQLTLFVLAPVIVTILFLRHVFPRVFQFMHRFFHNRARLSALVNDSISGMRVIKAFGQEDLEREKFDRHSGRYRDSGMDLVRQWSVYHPILHFLIIIGAVLVWLIGGNLVFAGRMTVGSVVAYSGYLAMFYRPVFVLTRMVQMILSSLSASERLFEVLDTEPEVRETPGALALDQVKGEIAFQNVTFGYDRFKPVIREMSFSIAANEIVGLVGKSGAGKSTIINLICRLYDPDSGAITLDKTDIRQVKYADLRRQIGVVLQDTFLFNGSIYENIAYARPEAGREEVIEAAIAANAHEFIVQKPDGYDTEVGERGNKLSGGEKQRISIARAILRDPRILILDEATSSVDTETEGKIQQALERLTRNRTTIAIAHRLSTLRNCNRLFVIDEGRVIETGTHEELIERKGAFFDLVNAQQKLSRIMAVDG